jgi:hypothetical protein
MPKHGLLRQSLGSAAITAALLVTSLSSACSAKSADVKPDTRTRNNESHVTIHQDAGQNDPIIGWAVENGNPSKSTFRAIVRFLELSVLGTADHPARCAIIIEKLVSHEPDEDPMSDDPTDLDFDIGSPQPTVERSYTMPCNERAESTRIVWPDGSIILLGHIEHPSDENRNDDSSDSNSWQFVVDEVTQAPKGTQLDDPGGSLMWATPSPSPKPWEVVRRSRADGRNCFSVLHANNYDLAAGSCARAADDFAYAANHVSERGTPSDVATLVIVSALYRKTESLALHRLARDSDSKDAFYEGKALLHAIFVTAGCSWCQSEAKKALKNYGEWPPRNDDI